MISRPGRLVLSCLAFFLCLPGLHAQGFGGGDSTVTAVAPGNGTTADGLVYSDNGTTITITGYTGSGGAVTVPATINGQPVTGLGDHAFANDTSLTSVALPNSITVIGDNAFYGCAGLTGIVIPSSVITIGSYAFANCTGLVSVQIPSSVTTIGSYAFDGCSSLIGVYFQGNTPALGSYAFLGAAPGFTTHYASGAGGSAQSISFDVATPTAISDPTGIAVDFQGNLYVSDGTNNVIWIVNSALQATILAGTGATGSADGAGSQATFDDPGALTIDLFGDVFVADTGNDLIREITAGGASVVTLAGTAGDPNSIYYQEGTGTSAIFNVPSGITEDGLGNLYIADTNNSIIRELNSADASSIVAGELNQGTGSNDATGIGASFNFPSGITIDNADNLFVADTNNDTIREIAPGDTVTTVAGIPGMPGSTPGAGYAPGTAFNGTDDTAQFNQPMGVAVDYLGNIYVADTGNNMIREIQLSNGTYTVSSNLAGTFNAPQGVAVDANGNVFVADTGDHVISELTQSNGAWSPTTLAITYLTPAAPTITTQPASLSIPVGGIASFSVAVNGTPRPAIQWQVEAAGTTTWTNMGSSLTSNNSLSFTGVLSTQSGSLYRCVVSNSVGTVTSNPAVLTVTGGAGQTETDAGALSSWFYGALGLLAVGRKLSRKRG